ncbi:hypothetical protein [Nocardia arthritidis]|uniref:DUF2613 family protein n=1 Tax=Nocardia arthritidis TaxID=228602 RepID=A0A6G9YBG0_9NOCA|nr:hypothetical protein [Nocardia arthritidis]QIS10561.1 hypothetical protein F5544_13360 [Nocardia arthritidis]
MTRLPRGVTIGLLAALAIVLGVASTIAFAATGALRPPSGRCDPPAATGRIVHVTDNHRDR